MTGASLQFTGVSRRYVDGERTLTVLDNASFSVAPGEFVAIEGPSGSGKSTLLHIAGGLDRAYQGSVKVDDRSLESMNDRSISKFRAATVGFVFQSFNLLPGLSALDNVTLSGFFSDAGNDGTERAREALAAVGLGQKAHRKPGELSGGERQRVALARALWTKPRLLLADEPTGNLDEHTGGQVIDLFTTLHKEHGVTIVIVTHEKRVSQVATRIVRLTDGQLVEQPR